jgi:hypothetical protein
MRLAEALERMEEGDTFTLAMGEREGDLEIHHARQRSPAWFELVTHSDLRIHVVNHRWVYVTDDDLEPIPGVDDALPAVMSLMDARWEGGDLVVAAADLDDFDEDDLRRAGVLG